MSHKYCWLIIIALVSSDLSARDALSVALSESKQWLMPAKVCPADVVTKDLDVLYNENACKRKEVACLARCKKNDAFACYNLALELQSQKSKYLDQYSEALFLRSCKLGSLSGCTNRAAGIDYGIGEKSTPFCSVKTYKKVCALGDPWACTMYGAHLSSGKVIKQNKKKAIEVMSISCKYGQDDPACIYSKEIIKDIQNKM